MADYLQFLARTATVVVGVAVAAAVITVLAARASRRARPRPHLEITDLGEKYDRLRRTMQQGLLPRKAFRAAVRAERRARKAAQDGTPGRDGSPGPEGKAPGRRPRVFVLDFVGDLRASAVAGLREEVTAVLAVAGDGDEVVVRLSNPGGLVNDQGLAASQLQRLRDRGVRLTVAVDTIAASGGYLMACAADRIVAAPFALVGSIGVIAQVPNVHRLLDRAGVRVDQFKGGEYKRTVTPFGDPTDEERAKFLAEIEDTHTLFKDFVARNRPQLDLAQVGTGEAWYGVRALDLGLVDELRTSDDYLMAARERADVYAIRYHRPGAAGRRAVPRVAASLAASVAASLAGWVENGLTAPAATALAD